MKTLQVNLDGRSYDILIGTGAFRNALEWMGSKDSCACVADAAFLRLHPEVRNALENAQIPVIEAEGGEKSKNLSEFGRLCGEFAKLKLDRSSTIAALGGGVVGDIAGFAASAYMRGIDFIQIPTTLLAMVDSSVGGKTGIDIPEGKNLVGAFWQPRAVFADLSFLKTLPKREFSAGCAEIIKCGILGDSELFSLLEDMPNELSADSPELEDAVRLSCALKAAVVAADERETAANGGRALLNLGHTYGHAVEKCAGYGTYLHGEAISIGTIFAAKLSEIVCSLPKKDYKRIEKLLKKNGLPVCRPEKLQSKELFSAMAHDKKTRGGKIRFVLIDKIGGTHTDIPDPDILRRLMDDF